MKTGLLLVDIQNDYFSGGNMELDSMQEAAARASRILKRFREARAPVFHIQHLSTRPGAAFFLPGTPGVEIHESVAPEGDEELVQKHFPNAFRETSLVETLRGHAIQGLVICGAMSHMCIDATTRAAFDYGFSCTVVSDACATRDLQFQGKRVPAVDVHASFMAALSVPFAMVVAAEELEVPGP